MNTLLLISQVALRLLFLSFIALVAAAPFIYPMTITTAFVFLPMLITLLAALFIYLEHIYFQFKRKVKIQQKRYGKELKWHFPIKGICC